MNHANKGSTLVLVLVAVLVLSIIGLSGLTQSSNDVATSRNFFAGKAAFFTAESGIHFGVNELNNAFDPTSVVFEQTDASGKLTFRSGRIEDAAAMPVMPFRGFKAPPPRGYSIEMGGEFGAAATPWQLTVNSNVQGLTRGLVRKEVETAIVTLSPEY
jgi:hypothetical protein